MKSLNEIFMFNFFKKEIFGLDISDHSVDVAILKEGSPKPILFQYGHTKLEKGIMENGKVLDENLLLKAISKVLKEAWPKPIKTKKFIFSLPASRVFTYFFEIPKEKGINKKNDLSELIYQKAEEIIPTNLKDCYLDYQVSKETEKSQKIFFLAVPKEIVDVYLSIFSKLKLKPVALDLENFSVNRALVPSEIRQKFYILLDIGARTTTLSIFDEGNLIFTSSIFKAGNYFNHLLMEELKINEEEAKELKKKIGLKEDSSSAKSKEVKSTLQKALKDIIIEVRKVIDYYQVLLNKKVDKIIACGGSSKMPGIIDYLNQELKIEVVLGTYQVNIPKNLKIDALLLADAIGSALRSLEKNPKKAGVNLLSSS